MSPAELLQFNTCSQRYSQSALLLSHTKATLHTLRDTRLDPHTSYKSTHRLKAVGTLVLYIKYFHYIFPMFTLKYRYILESLYYLPNHSYIMPFHRLNLRLPNMPHASLPFHSLSLSSRIAFRLMFLRNSMAYDP